MTRTRWIGWLLPPAIAATWSPAALAEETRTGTSETVTERGGPSRTMLSSGVVTLGLTYGAAAVVAATSDRDADHRMFVPIAGPWMALFDRGDCGGMTGRSCDTETTYKVLIVADGIGQGLGAITIVEAFLNPEVVTVSRTRTGSVKPTLRLTPARLGAGSYGMLALGTF